ncbi:hypothetical protein ILUMI_10456 [Ignelater luminosus]|uniref:Uncharacterized protein n=1 Tax=Ignelater luminosus TaxID=2038154 RepID=A0A8K0CXV2_IGNLU|nr:hypothetical protein ILUMI_10456 [Ignelater luminosus]
MITCPKYTENQEKTAKKLCRKLYERKPNKILILDDESYIMCDPENIPEKKYYNYSDKASVPSKQKFKSKKKIVRRSGACIGTVHKSGICKNWLEAEGIEYVAYADNPTNVPQARPIERFWAICKRKYSESCRTITALSRFRKIWKDISAEVARSSGQSLMAGVRKKLRKTGREGVHSII